MNNHTFAYMRYLKTFITLIVFFPTALKSQNIEKVFFNTQDSTNGYYLSIKPASGNIKAVQVLLRSFNGPESIIPETKLHNIAYANDILTIMASMNDKFYADTAAVNRIDSILKDVVGRFSADTSKFVMAGFDLAGNIVLRYTEMCYEFPAKFPLRPKAVFTIQSAVDLGWLWHWCDNEIKKNYDPGNVGDAKYLIDVLNREKGNPDVSFTTYVPLSPFFRALPATGNERYLKNVPVRLYYDTDIGWELKTKRNSYYDTPIPDGSDLVNKLQLLGNNSAEFISSKLPGVRSNGTRNPVSWSIVDEVECIQWIKKKLDLFDPNSYIPTYNFSSTSGWGTERFTMPPDFAPQIPYKGIEDVRFAPGWGDSTSQEYWSYAYLWWLDGNQQMDTINLAANLKHYYSGLVGRNILSRKIPVEKIVPTEVTIDSIDSALAGDFQTFKGEIHMLDYMTQNPVVLNAIIHVKKCSTDKHTPVIIEISPKAYDQPVWADLNKFNESFQCEK